MKFTGERVVIGDGFVPEDTLRQHLARYEFATAFVKDMIVVDVACGSGYGSRMMGDSGARQVAGIDIDPEAVRYATQTYQSDSVSFCLGDAMDTRLAAGYVDVVVSFETIEHVSNPERSVAEAHRILRPGGTYLASTPNGGFPWRWSGGKPANVYHVTEFLEAEFRALLERHFKYVKMYYQGHVFEQEVTRWSHQEAMKTRLRRLGPIYNSLARVKRLAQNVWCLGMKVVNTHPSVQESTYAITSLEAASDSHPVFLVAVCHN